MIILEQDCADKIRKTTPLNHSIFIPDFLIVLSSNSTATLRK